MNWAWWAMLWTTVLCGLMIAFSGAVYWWVLFFFGVFGLAISMSNLNPGNRS